MKYSAAPSWYVADLGDAMLANDAIRSVESGFARSDAGPDDTGTRAVFIRHESEGRLHCTVVVYFSPGAAALARDFAARPCARPEPSGLGLLAGGPDAWHVLFPERAADPGEDP